MLPDELRKELLKLGTLPSEHAQRIAERVRTRSCGPCRVCCTIKGVEDLAPPKPSNEPCSKLCGRGCSAYKERPTSCRTYLCAWRLGLGGSEARPDRCGVLVDVCDMAEVGGDAKADYSGGLTVRCGGKPFDPRKVASVLEDAWGVGPFYVALVDPEADAEPPGTTTAKYDPDPRSVVRGLATMGRTGRAPLGSWRRTEKRAGD